MNGWGGMGGVFEVTCSLSAPIHVELSAPCSTEGALSSSGTAQIHLGEWLKDERKDRKRPRKAMKRKKGGVGVGWWGGGRLRANSSKPQVDAASRAPATNLPSNTPNICLPKIAAGCPSG